MSQLGCVGLGNKLKRQRQALGGGGEAERMCLGEGEGERKVFAPERERERERERMGERARHLTGTSVLRVFIRRSQGKITRDYSSAFHVCPFRVGVSTDGSGASTGGH